jgi:hypothetical protein
VRPSENVVFIAERGTHLEHVAIQWRVHTLPVAGASHGRQVGLEKRLEIPVAMNEKNTTVGVNCEWVKARVSRPIDSVPSYLTCAAC